MRFVTFTVNVTDETVLPAGMDPRSKSTPAYQTKGSVGVRAYVATSTTSVPIVVSFDELLVRPASRL